MDNAAIEGLRAVTIDMTLTAPACPVAGEMPGWVENAVGAVPGVSGAKVNMVFDPPWDQSWLVGRGAGRARHVVERRRKAASMSACASRPGRLHFYFQKRPAPA